MFSNGAALPQWAVGLYCLILVVDALVLAIVYLVATRIAQNDFLDWQGLSYSRHKRVAGNESIDSTSAIPEQFRKLADEVDTDLPRSRSGQ